MSMMIAPYRFAPPAVPVTSLSFFDSATGATTGTATPVPAGLQAGDVMFFFDRRFNISGGEPAEQAPSGFTAIGSVVQGSGRFVASYKVAGGSETSIEFLATGSTSSRRILLVFRPNIPATSVTVGDIEADTNANNPVAHTVSASAGAAPLVVLAMYGTQNPSTESVDPRTMSPAKDGEVSQDVGLWAAWKIYNSSPADVTVDMDDEGAGNAMISFYARVA